MPDVVQNVVIDFQVNDQALKPAVDQVTELGEQEKLNAEAFKSANAELNKQIKILDQLSRSGDKTSANSAKLKNTFQDIIKVVNSMGSAFKEQFILGAKDALAEAGVSAEEFEKALNKAAGTTEKSTKSLKAQLREMVAQLAQLKVAGQDQSQEYTELAQKAGALKDAIGDANQEIKNFSSDTSTFDGLIQGVQGLAGGFAIVQGATALFGDESEELQKTLLKVNAAMAILQGLQQIQIVLQKESAVSQLANTIATKGQIAAQIAYNFVVGTSTGLLKVFRIALASTGVGLFIIGLAVLIEALSKTDDSLERVTKDIDLQSAAIERNNQLVQDNADIAVARAQAIGAAESEIIRIRGRSLLQQRANLAASNATLAAERDALDPTTEAWFKLNDAIEKNGDAIRGIDKDTTIAAINLEKQLADERKEAAEKRLKDTKEAADKAKQLAEKAAAEAKEQREKDFNDFKAKKELELLATEKGSEEELAARKQLALATLQVELNNEKLTDNQRKLLIQNFFKDRLALEKEFGKAQNQLARENAIAESQTALSQLELSAQDRLTATEFIISEQAQIEIAAAEGNAIKIRQIAAKRDEDIRTARIASIQAEVDYELALREAEGGPAKRNLERDIENQKKLREATTSFEEESIRKITGARLLSLKEQEDQIDELAALNSSAIQTRIDAINKEREQGLISQKQYNLSYSQLVDEQTKIWEDAEKEKSDITKKESARRIKQTAEDIARAAEIAKQFVGVLSDFYAEDNDRQNQQLAEQKQRVKDLLESGAITEKEASNRNKRLDAEEKRIKQQQAERDKRIALFQAVLAIPQAFLKGLTDGGLPLAIVYGALATIQAGLIASRKVPKFSKGKKDGYEGPGIVGEAGTELVEQNGRLWVAKKEEMVWLGKNDKVYNPRETLQMLSKPSMNIDRSVMNSSNSSASVNIDYVKMGKEVGKHLQTNVYVDGVHAQHKEKELFEKYLTNRRNRK